MLLKNKIRGWNIKKKIMYSSEELSDDQLTISCDGKGFINIDSISTRNSEYYAHIIPLISIGYYDKNNKEIFEGDVLKSIMIYSPEYSLNRFEEVKIIEVKIPDFYLFLGSDSVQNGLLTPDGLPDDALNKFVAGFEIIGNIYENPELI